MSAERADEPRSDSGSDHDVIVIGAGPAGENVAARAVRHGLSAAIIERELVGGECSYWACMPSKALLRPGEALADARRVPGAGAALQGSPDVAAALAWRDQKASGGDDSGQVEWLEGAGVTLVRGEARLDGPRRVVVDGPDGERVLTAARAVVIATGSAAAMPPVDGLDRIEAWDNREGTRASALPRTLIVLGGGPVGLELAQAWRRLGVDRVTLLESEAELLPDEEPFVGERIAEALAEDGIDVRTGAELQSVERRDGQVHATLADGSRIAAQELLVATGRRPRTVGLGLETVGLTPGESIAVDDRLRATGVQGEWLYAVGDVNGRNLLTHMGKYQARVAADVIAGADAAATSDHTAVPRVIYTDPQIAAVGMTEAAARAQGKDVRLGSLHGGVAATGLAGEGARHDALLVVDAARRVVVGATFVGPSAAELVHAATIAIVGELPLATLWQAVPAFPAHSEVWLRLLEDLGL